MNRKYFTIIFLSVFLALFFHSSAKATDYFVDIPDNVFCQQYVYNTSGLANTRIYYYPEVTSYLIGKDKNPQFFAIKQDDVVINNVTHTSYLVIMKSDATGKYNIDSDVCFIFSTKQQIFRHTDQPYIKSYSDEDLKFLVLNNSDLEGFYVSNPVFSPSVKVFESFSDFSVFVENGLEDPSLPDNPPVETGNPKITLSSGEYYLIDTNKKICGVLNADSEYYYYNKQKTDIELFLIDTDSNDNKFILNSENVNAVKYSSTGQYLDEQTVKLVTINRNCKPFLMRSYLNNSINFIPHKSCLSIDKVSTYTDFTLVAPSHPALLRYLLNDLSDGEDDTFPVFPVPEDTPDPVNPTPIDIPDEWGFLGDLFDSFVGTANQLLNSIKSNLKSLSNVVGEGFDSLSSGISSFKNSVMDGISSLASDIGTSVSNGISNVLKDLFIPEDGYLNDRISSIRNKFAFADSILSTAQGLLNMFNSISGNNAPSITVHLSSKTSGAFYGDKDIVISLEWYKPYKPTIDALISGILWAGYIWLIIKRVPELIKGSGMITENVLSINKK